MTDLQIFPGLKPQERLPLIVSKFGGTSIGNAHRLVHVANVVKDSLLNSQSIVVLSAMSSYQKVDGTTSRLLRAAQEVLIPNSTQHLDLVELIEESHLIAAANGIQDEVIRNRIIGEVKSECSKLRGFLEATEVIDEVSLRSRDMIISYGEKLSSRIFAAILNSIGVPAIYINLEKLVDKHFDERNLDQSFYDYLSVKLGSLLEKYLYGPEPRVPVVTGYLGPVPGSLLSSIGRGYTDLTAALIAVGLSASELQIWKEVDGIFTADPRKVPGAKLLTFISPEEAAELTYYGSEVIHPFTMEQVIRKGVPIRIKNTFRPEGRGTLIVPDSLIDHYLQKERENLNENSSLLTPFREEDTMEENPNSPFHSLHTSIQPSPTPSIIHSPTSLSSLPLLSSSPPSRLPVQTHSPLSKHPTAVTIKDGLTVLNIHSNRKSVSHGFFKNIFEVLDTFGVIVDLISTSEVHVSMVLGGFNSIESSGLKTQEEALNACIQSLRKFGTVDKLVNMSILSLVGKQMKNMVGVASQMFSVLANHSINIEMISQGASEINISCVIEEKLGVKALGIVHDFCVVGISNSIPPLIKLE